MSGSLRGARILVTRPVHQADKLCRLIEAHEGIPVRFPTLAIKALDSAPTATIWTEKLSKSQLTIFTSVNAVNFALAAIGGKIRPFVAPQVAAIGQATASALRTAGVPVKIEPKSGFDSESLLMLPELQDLAGKQVILIKGKGGREKLAEVLAERGARVEQWEVYQRALPVGDNSQVRTLLNNGQLDMVVSTSGESLENLITMLGEDALSGLTAIPLVVVSDRVGEIANQIGFTRVAVAGNPSDQAILDATITIINEDQRG